MGVVYMAEQAHPVRRRVALKVIKPGMDTRQVVARFEAERQALALMDHPNIAKVHDAGATDSGRPYFVMELVKGIPITDYCDQARLSIPERLDLFVLVCRAVQHAHQKGVIHRDLKPSNILVTLIDGAAVPKVIDFGVAKATGAQPHRADALHRLRAADRHAAVHEPRAGRAVGRRRRHPQRHLRPGRAPVRAADRHDAHRPGDAGQGGLRRGPADHPRAGDADAEHAAGHAGRDARDRLGQPPRRRAEAGPCRAGRAGLDRDEGAGEGPAPAVRDGQRLRRRRDAAPDRPAGGGVPAVGVVSVLRSSPGATGRP